MGHHDDGRAAAIDFLQEVHDLTSHLRVEIARRLVGEEEERVAGQRPGDRDPLLLATGKLGREMAQARRQADALERVLDPFASLAIAEAAIAERDVDVVEEVQVRDQIE